MIAATVLIQGLSAGTIAGILGLRRPSNQGYVILGANELGHLLGRLLRKEGEEVIFIDTNPTACERVSEDGFRVIYGNANEDRTLLRARLEDRAASIALTPNEEANLLFSRKAKQFRVPRIFLALGKNQSTVTESMVRQVGGLVLFGAPRDLELWAVRLRRGIARVEEWRLVEEPKRKKEDGSVEVPDLDDSLVFPLTVCRDGKAVPVHGGNSFRKGDRVRFALFLERSEAARANLRTNGWAGEDGRSVSIGTIRGDG